MALPNALVNFASPIVETALKTGARGESTTVTDYGVIGDAFFKKAQLDLGIAELKGNMAMQSAKLMADINQDNARMDLSMVQKKMDYDLSLRELRQQLKAEEVSTFEAVMGSISGAATGAAGGFMVGGPVGAVVGGVAGGGLTAAGYATSGRKGGQAAQQMIGNVANLAVAVKGAAQEKKANDVMSSGMKTAQGFAAIINDLNQPAEARIEAGRKLDALIGNMQSQLFEVNGGNLENAMKSAQGIKGLVLGQGGSGGSGGGSSRAWELANLQLGVKAKGDTRFDDPKLAGQARQEYVDQFRANFASQFGADKEMDPDLLAGLVRSSGINKRRGIMEIDNPGQDVAAGPADQWGNLPMVPEAQAAPRQSNRVRGVSGRTPALQSPQDGESVEQPAPQRSAPVQRRFASSGPTQPSGPGLVMDDGGPSITSPQAVAPITKQGTETAKILAEQQEKDKPGLLERGFRKIQEITGSDGGPVDEYYDKKDAERRARDPKLREANAKESQRLWDEQVANEPASTPKEKQENEAWFKSKDPKEIQRVLGADKKDAKTMEERDRIGAIAATPAIMNRIKEKSIELNKLLPSDPEARKELAEQYALWKFGEGGPEGNMRIKGDSKGLMVKGTGGSIQQFEKNFSMQLEKMGVKPGTPEAKEIWKKFVELDASVGPLAGKLAKANLGGQLSDRDIAIHTVKNALDPDADIMISGITEQQRDLLTTARSILNVWPSKEEALQEKVATARAGRESLGEKITSKIAEKRIDEQFRLRQEESKKSAGQRALDHWLDVSN